jgi:hypothetical protein
MVVEGAALLAAAIRAAIHAKAPRRTVQAVAAAVTGVLWRPTAAAEPHIDARMQAGTTVDDVRADRSAQRQRKKERRRSAAAKAANAAPAPSAEVLQCKTVRAEATLVAEAAFEVGIAHGALGSKRRKKGGDSGRLGGGAATGDALSLKGVEVLQCNAVRASAPSDVADEEVLDDYWADEGMPQAAVDTETVRADSAEKEAISAALASGALRRKKLQKLRASAESLMVKITSEGDDPRLGLASHHAVAARDRLQLFDRLLGLDDVELAGTLWPPTIL